MRTVVKATSRRVLAGHDGRLDLDALLLEHRPDETVEERRGPVRSAQELGMELSADEVRMHGAGEFHDLHDGLVGHASAEDDARLLEPRNVFRVDLVAV